MAITRVYEVWGEGGGGSLSEDGTRKYTRHFTVEVDSYFDDALVVTNHPTIPLKFASYVNPTAGTSDLYSLCRSITAERDSESPLLWHVTANYTTSSPPAYGGGSGRGGGAGQAGSGDGSRYQEDPLLRPPDISWGTQLLQRTMDFDAIGSAVVNSAGEKFDPPLMRDVPFLTLSVSRNEAAPDPLRALAIVNKVNEETFYGFTKGCVKCTGNPQVLASDNGRFYWRHTYEFQIRDEFTVGGNTYEGWAEVVLDAGFNQIVSGKLVAIADKSGQATSVPRPLDGAGAALAVGSTAYRWLDFYPHNYYDFNTLGL